MKVNEQVSLTDDVVNLGLEVGDAVAHGVLDVMVVIHDAPAAPIEDLHFAEGHDDPFELVIPTV